MSIDIDIYDKPSAEADCYCEKCGLEHVPARGDRVFEGNQTYNTAGMWYLAGWDIRAWNGKRAGDMIPTLEAAMADMERRPAAYEKLNPENGWGDFEGFRRFTGRTLAACREYPDGKISVS